VDPKWTMEKSQNGFGFYKEKFSFYKKTIIIQNMKNTKILASIKEQL
jgi:hypothetical protein